MNNSKCTMKRILVVSILINLIFIQALKQVKASSVKKAPIQKSVVQKNIELPSLGDYNQSKKLSAREYVLGANDIISIEALGIPELTREIRVQPDGKISIPYFEALYVAGKTIPQVQEIIKKTYDEYLEDPKLSIKLVQTRPFIVYVSGAILNPGSYELNTITNQSPYFSKPEAFIERKTPLLSNILVAAGGISHDADAEHAVVTNDFNNTHIEVNLIELIKNADSSQDIYLTAGDRVYIPKLASTNLVNLENYKLLVTSTIFQRTMPVKVIGYVNNPGLVTLNSQQSANLTSAIAQAGGYLKDSAYLPKKVIVSRADNNNKLVSFKIDPREKELMLMPNDIVYVPEKIRPNIGKFFDYTSRLLSPVYMFASTYRNWDGMFVK